MRARLGEAGIRVVQTPYRAPNANAYAERFVRSIKQECLSRVIPFGERHLRRTIAHTSSIITASGIIRGWTTRSSMTARTGRRGSGFAVGRGSVGCSITTNEPREGHG